MDFSQTRLKLRVAVCPYIAPSGPEYHHRVVGVKRDASVNASLVILRQFLLLLPLDCTFSDLTNRVISQYEKLYQNQPAYVPIKSVTLFRDSNQCDLDLDYLVSDICASNDLIYAMVEIEEQNKKVKVDSFEKSVEIKTNNISTTASKNVNVQNVKVQNVKVQNETKVPEFKPTVIKTPVTKLNPTPVIKQDAVKNNPKPPSSPVKVAVPADKKPENKTVKPEEVKPAAAITAAVKPEEVKHVAVKTEEVKPSVTTATIATVKPVPISNPAKKIQIPSNEIKETVSDSSKMTGTPKLPETKVSMTETPKIPETLKLSTETPKLSSETPKLPETKLSETTKSEIVKPVITEEIIKPNISYSDALNNGKRSSELITPVPTPISRPVFHPRKTEMSSSSSSEEDGEESVSGVNFDASNLFGSQVIASEPRRSDAFVLFAADSSSEDEEDSSEAEAHRVILAPLKSSSIVSLQAVPSSELDNNVHSSTSEEEEEVDLLPQSVTLRRLSSVSPIPDSSEIPSLNELKESINRTPTPVQILNNSKQPQPQPQQSKPKGGRPAKKQHAGRPKKESI